MRALLAASALLIVLFAPTGAAILPAACGEGNATSASNYAWTPGCIRLFTGEVLTFSGASGTHNARSSQDDLAILRAVAPVCFETPNFAPGQAASVRFVHDSHGVTASLRAPDGSWSPARDCALAVDPLLSTPTDASIPFECGIHPTMTGRIVVVALG